MSDAPSAGRPRSSSRAPCSGFTAAGGEGRGPVEGLLLRELGDVCCRPPYLVVEDPVDDGRTVGPRGAYSRSAGSEAEVFWTQEKLTGGGAIPLRALPLRVLLVRVLLLRVLLLSVLLLNVLPALSVELNGRAHEERPERENRDEDIDLSQRITWVGVDVWIANAVERTGGSESLPNPSDFR